MKLAERLAVHAAMTNTLGVLHAKPGHNTWYWMQVHKDMGLLRRETVGFVRADFIPDISTAAMLKFSHDFIVEMEFRYLGP